MLFCPARKYRLKRLYALIIDHQKLARKTHQLASATATPKHCTSALLAETQKDGDLAPVLKSLNCGGLKRSALLGGAGPRILWIDYRRNALSWNSPWTVERPGCEDLERWLKQTCCCFSGVFFSSAFFKGQVQFLFFVVFVIGSKAKTYYGVDLDGFYLLKNGSINDPNTRIINTWVHCVPCTGWWHG